LLTKPGFATRSVIREGLTFERGGHDRDGGVVESERRSKCSCRKAKSEKRREGGGMSRNKNCSTEERNQSQRIMGVSRGVV
jgi:hypothetical protein